MRAITKAQFDFLRSLLHRESAIVLEPGKEYLAERLLAPIARREGLSIGDLLQRLSSAPNPALRADVVDAMTTNETSFFRDRHPWQTLESEILPALFAQRASTRRLSIWCAACSSGQEPYSLAILLRDAFPEQCATWDIRITATDLSAAMVERCRRGTFSDLEVSRGLPASALERHFHRDGAEWRVGDALRSMVEARAANLVVPASMPAAGGLDLVMVRNVLIYFDEPTKAKVLTAVRSRMRPDGYLMLGSSEVTTGADAGFTRHQIAQSIVFRPT